MESEQEIRSSRRAIPCGMGSVGSVGGDEEALFVGESEGREVGGPRADVGPGGDVREPGEMEAMEREHGMP
jgi:hypothetical protein